MPLVQLNFGNLIGNNGTLLSRAELEGLSPRLKNVRESLKKGMEKGALDWMKLPAGEGPVKAMLDFHQERRNQVKNFVVVGIGGSSLGNRTLHGALNHSFHNELPEKLRGGAKIYYTDTVDPRYLGHLLEVLPIDGTLFNVITKSGSTAETMSQCLHFVNLLKKRGGKLSDHLVMTTDREKGALQEIIKKENLQKFVIDDTVGGRYSVFSPVGLLSALFSGIDIRAMLRGAAKAQEAIFQQEPLANSSMVYAAVHYLLYQKGHHLSVFMPYHFGLASLADWYCQLWAESLGKKCDRQGKVVELATQPVRAVGPTDQHSMLQLFMEGGRDKIIVFVRVNDFQSQLNIGPKIPELKGVDYLAEKSFSSLLLAEQTGTEIALTRAGRPVLRWEMAALEGESLGALMQSLMLATAVAGELFDINAFDQPGVEAGKDFTYGLMGKPGFEKKRDEVEELLSGGKSHFTQI